MKTYLWDFGDGNTSTEENPSHTYELAGSYTVTLTITDTGFTGTKTKVDYITVTESFLGFTFYVFFNTLAFQTEIRAWMEAQVPRLDPLNYGQGFNTVDIPTGANVYSTFGKITNWNVNNAIIGQRSMTFASAYGYTYQFELYLPIRTGSTMFFGYWTQAYGPPFDPNEAYGGPFGTYLESDGVTSWITQYGGGGATGLPGIQVGDFVTCVYVPDTASVNFFINSSWVAAGSVVNGDGYALIGST